MEGQAAQGRQARVRVLVDPLLQQTGDLGMQPGSLVGEQVVVHRLAEEPVPEHQRARLSPQEVRVEQLAEEPVELRLVGAGQLRERVGVDAGPVDGGDAQQVTRAGRQGVDPRQEQVGQLLGDRLRIGRRQLLGVERVPFRAVQHRAHQRRIGRASRMRLHDAGNAPRVEGSQVEMSGAGEPTDLGQGPAGGMAPVQVVGADGEHEEKLSVRPA